MCVCFRQLDQEASLSSVWMMRAWTPSLHQHLEHLQWLSCLIPWSTVARAATSSPRDRPFEHQVCASISALSQDRGRTICDGSVRVLGGAFFSSISLKLDQTFGLGPVHTPRFISSWFYFFELEGTQQMARGHLRKSRRMSERESWRCGQRGERRRGKRSKRTRLVSCSPEEERVVTDLHWKIVMSLDVVYSVAVSLPVTQAQEI